jgi:hypothetical protein
MRKFSMWADKDVEYYDEKYSDEVEVMELLNKYSSLLREYRVDILNGDLDALKEIVEFRERNDDDHGCNYFLTRIA